MWSTPASTARRSTASAPARSLGGPNTPGPGSCIAPNPMRWTGRPASTTVSEFMGPILSQRAEAAGAGGIRPARHPPACRPTAVARRWQDLPVRYADGPTVRVDLLIDAPIERVWALVSDVGVPALFSTELQEGRWLDVDPGPSVGSRFVGR